jgi:primosomal protein N' (replication factor Y)
MPSFYYQIIPLIKIPLKTNPLFTYQSATQIPFGSLVEISFGRKKIRGIVLEKIPKPNFKVKKISKILSPETINKNQLEIAKKISDYYLTSLGITLKLFVFNLTKKEVSLKNHSIQIEKPKTIALTSEQKKALKKIKIKSKNLIFGPASSGKTELAMNLIEKNLKKNKQALVILPEIFLSYQEIYRYQSRFKKNKIALLHSKLKPSEKSTIWKQIKEGKIDILISTKMGCFLPFKNLGVIVVDEEQDISHKNWDQQPKYHTEKITEWLAFQNKAYLVFLSATPSIKNYWKAQKNQENWNLIQIPSLKTDQIKIKKPQIKIIDLWEKRYLKKGQIIFSQDLIEAFKDNLKARKIGLILVPYHGKSQMVVCENCKNHLKCPNCHNSLIYSGDHYKCLHCNYKISALSSCPKCKSYKLKTFGFGTESVTNEIKTLFPQARIKTAPSSLFENPKVFNELFQAIRKNKLDFLIGTQVIAKGFDFPNINLVAVLNAQRWSGKSDFNFDEHWLGSFFQIAGRLNRPLSDQKGKFYLQTFKPNVENFIFLEKWDWTNFIKKELETRKALGYPPFKNLIKISLKNINKNKVEKNTQKVYNQLSSLSENKDIEISEPYYGFIKKKAIFWQKHILIKLSRKDSKQTFKKEFIKISSEWSVDVDPENIF